MRQKSRELYKVLHQTCMGKLHMRIISLTTYTRMYSIKKYHTFVKLFCMDMNKQMNAYHLSFYLNDSTAYENPATYN